MLILPTDALSPPLQVRSAETHPFVTVDANCDHPSLSPYRIKSETLQEFGVGFCHSDGALTGRLALPVHDSIGTLIGWAGRAVHGESPLYVLSPGVDGRTALFNLHRALQFTSSRFGDAEVVVVADPLDCLKVHDACFHSVVAPLSLRLSPSHRDLLTSHFGMITLLLSLDEFPQDTIAEIATDLARTSFVRVRELPPSWRVSTMCAEEIRDLLLG